MRALKEGASLATEPRVLGMQKAVSYLIGASEFRIPRPNSVLVVETPEEILSDKVRALLERPYLKGRDIYDVWHLRDRLRVPVVRKVMERKFSCYAAPFTPRRRPAWFESNDKELVEAIEGDLRRFLSPEMMEVCRGDGYRRFLDAVKGSSGNCARSAWWFRHEHPRYPSGAPGLFRSADLYKFTGNAMFF